MMNESRAPPSSRIQTNIFFGCSMAGSVQKADGISAMIWTGKHSYGLKEQPALIFHPCIPGVTVRQRHIYPIGRNGWRTMRIGHGNSEAQKVTNRLKTDIIEPEDMSLSKDKQEYSPIELMRRSTEVNNYLNTLGIPSSKWSGRTFACKVK